LALVFVWICEARVWDLKYKKKLWMHSKIVAC
jgi:hypothetical protein